MRKLPSLLLVWLTLQNPSRAGEIESLLQREMQSHHVVGMACLVVSNGVTLTRFFSGQANLEWSSPVDEKTVFEIGSVSKQFAAASIGLLVQAGKISVEDPITKFFTNAPASWHEIKVRHLLAHTSGLKNYDGLPGFELRQHLTQSEFISHLAAQPVEFAPGQKWAYCNSGYNLLGYIVENVSGKNYWDFLREHIFEPLQMTNTTRRDPWLVIPRRAAGYEFKDGRHQSRDYDLTDLFAAGAMVSTVDDLAKWNTALFEGKILVPKTRELWWQPAVLDDGRSVQTPRHGQPGSYGRGWFISTVNGARNVGHSGITSGFSTANELFPELRLQIIIVANTDEGVFAGELANQIARLLLNAPNR